MKGSSGVSLVLLLTSSTAVFSGAVFWEDGKEYHFLEESAVHVGTSDVASSVSGMRMKTDVKVQVSGNKLYVSLDNVHEAHYSHSYSNGGWPYRLEAEKDEHAKSKYEIFFRRVVLLLCPDMSSPSVMRTATPSQSLWKKVWCPG